MCTGLCISTIFKLVLRDRHLIRDLAVAQIEALRILHLFCLSPQYIDPPPASYRLLGTFCPWRRSFASIDTCHHARPEKSGGRSHERSRSKGSELASSANITCVCATMRTVPRCATAAHASPVRSTDSVSFYLPTAPAGTSYALCRIDLNFASTLSSFSPTVTWNQ